MPANLNRNSDQMNSKNKILAFLYLIFVLSQTFSSCNIGRDIHRAFYVSPDGSDENDGSRRYPFRSLERVNRMILDPGDTIYLEGGKEFQGTFFLDSIDSGDETGKVVLSSYGNGRATINGGDREAIVIDNSEYFSIRDLIVKGNGRKSGNVSNGILIITSENFDVENVDISGFQHSGLQILGSINGRIRGVTAHDNGFAGIHVSGKNVNDPAIFDNENLYIGYCKAFNNPGDPTVLKNHSGNGILAASVNGGIIEYCEAFNNGWDMPWTGNGPVGIWIWDCTNMTIQYCLSHHNKTNPVAADGGGFDLDGGVSNSVIQYCVSWSNQGAGIGLFEFGASKPWENNVVRYNVSRNDGIKNGGSIAIWKTDYAGSMRNCAVYNNTFLNDTLRGVNIALLSNSDYGFTFRNNIFIFSRSLTGDKQKISQGALSGNCYWKVEGNGRISNGLRADEGLEESGVFADPMLGDPHLPLKPEMTLFNGNNLSGFSLRKGSPAAGAGVDPGAPYGIGNNYIGITGVPVKRNTVFDIGAAGYSIDLNQPRGK